MYDDKDNDNRQFHGFSQLLSDKEKQANIHWLESALK